MLANTPLLRKELLHIAEMIPASARVLDVGCGGGELLEHLARTKAVDARGIDAGDIGGASGSGRGGGRAGRAGDGARECKGQREQVRSVHRIPPGSGRRTGHQRWRGWRQRLTPRAGAAVSQCGTGGAQRLPAKGWRPSAHAASGRWLSRPPVRACRRSRRGVRACTPAHAAAAVARPDRAVRPAARRSAPPRRRRGHRP